MSDIEKFISERKTKSPKAWAGFEEKYRKYAIGMLLAEYRVKSGMTLAEFAKKAKMAKSALSRLENHGEDVRLSTIARYVETAGRPLELKFFPVGKRRSKTPGGAQIELQSA
ncbi:MAG: helix-turn-helix domain-containing protein [Opitutaceae bacterium]|jgi:transcriptional regulator with XRE-family HTH domain